MKKKIRTLMALILSMLCILSLVGCNNAGGTGDKDDSAEAIDLGGREINLVAWGDGVFSLLENSDDELTQTYYARKQEMEEKYNCTIVTKKVGASEILPGLRAAEMADTVYADAVAMRTAWAKSAYDEGLLLELGQLFDEDEVNNFYSLGVDCLKQDDGSFYTISFYKENPVENIYYFNIDHFENQGIDVDALYQEVLDGKWTFERMTEIAEQAMVEKNGVVEVYGAQAALSGDSFGHYLAPFGAQAMIKNEDGTYSSGLKTDNMKRAFETLTGTIQNDAYWGNAGGGWETCSQMFQAGTLAMYTDSLAGYVTITQNAPFEVGVLPMPKASEEDADYTYSAMTLNVVAIPAAVGKDKEVAQAIADMLAYIYAPLEEDASATLERKYGMYCSNEKQVEIIVNAGLSDNFVFTNYLFTGLKSNYDNICGSTMKSILQGTTSFRAGTDAIDEAWQSIIDEYNDSLK
ncbi:MAG: extracellular solute-binding protein [Tyzzerella sp.]|nr:extracellular solute-binding protein [Tyzzerella sp.]